MIITTFVIFKYNFEILYKNKLIPILHNKVKVFQGYMKKAIRNSAGM